MEKERDDTFCTPAKHSRQTKTDIHQQEISTFVFVGLTGSALLPLNPSILEISLLAIERSDILLLAGQGLPRALNRLTMTFKPHRSPIPIRVMENTDLLDSSVESSHAINDEDFTIINNFIERLPKPVCLVSYTAEIYDYKVIRKELNRLDRNINNSGLLCTSLRKAVRQFRPNLESYELNNVYRVVCKRKSEITEESAENVVRMLTEIVSCIPGTIGWIDRNFELF
ncbi:three-prime repair exonuclease 1-like [Ylistrum balloti]|uniref:three-prime repair exonuclease 1-like n=1 Tax=Ylistrum balloti TaxID=509963 RepID=UPI002905F58C|nr:three-prime repair exonuclease 1-like [Ylistrum balloti]